MKTIKTSILILSILLAGCSGEDIETHRILYILPQKTQNFIGEYDVHYICNDQKNKTQSVDDNKLNIYKYYDTEFKVNIQMFIHFPENVLLDGFVFNDSSFIVNYKNAINESGSLMEFWSGEGRIRNDSIFIHYGIYTLRRDKDSIIDYECNCERKKIE